MPREWDAQGNLITEEPARPRRRREWDADGNPITEAAPPEPADLTAGRSAAYAHGGTFGAADEIVGGISGLISGIGEFARDDGVMRELRGRPESMGERFSRSVDAGVRSGRETRNRFLGDISAYRAERPIEAAGVEIAGGIGSPANVFLARGVQALPGGGALSRAAAGRGPGALAAQAVQGAEAGIAGGGAYGFLAADGDMAERGRGAKEGAGYGAALGIAAPFAVAGGRRVLEPAWRAFERFTPMPAPNTLGAMGGNLRRAPANRPPPLPREAAGTIDRIADRAGLSAADVERRLARARERPMGQALVDVFDDPGRRTMAAIAQGPGRTGQRALETYRTRAAEQPGRILGSLREGLRVSETRQQALGRLAREYDRASAETYQPVFQQRLGPEQRAILEQRLAAYSDDPVFQDAVRRAEAVFTRDRRNGLVGGEIDDNFARWAHYLKLGMDDAAKLSANPSAGGVGPTELRGIREMRARIIEAIDESVPGYREARSRWGGLINAEEALDEGAGFLNMLPEEVSARMAQMTDFERMHARIGLVDEITRNMRGGRVVGNRNVANALDFKDTQDVIAAVFDNEQQAADFLDVLNTSNELMRNAGSWGGGSSTYSNALHGADEAMNAGVDAAMQGASGNFGGAVRRGADYVRNAATLGMVERANNIRGEALLHRVDTKDSAEFARAVVAELRRRQAARRAGAAAVRSSGGVAGPSGRQRD